MNFSQIILEKEQQDLFIQIVDEIKEVPRGDRRIINTKRPSGDWLTVGTEKQKIRIDNIVDGDLHELVRKELLKLVPSGRGTEAFSLTPEGLNYYDWLTQNKKEVAEQNKPKEPVEYELGDIDPEVKNIIKSINQLKQELDRLSPMQEEYKSKLMRKVHLDWTFHSCKLEGNELTYGETRELLHYDRASNKGFQDHREIKGHDEAISYVEEVIENEEFISEKLIRELNQKVIKEPFIKEAITEEGQPTSKEIIPGEYKTTPNHVQTKEGNIFRFAEPREVPQEMEFLLNWFKNEVQHPLIKAAQLHYRFVLIHPFDDGNGRVARLLMNYSLIKDGYPPVIIKTEQKEEYHSCLRKADAGELESLLIFIGNSLAESMEMYINAAKGKEIDEYDDLDKRLTMLREKASQDGKDKIRQKRSKEIIEKRFEDSIWPFFQSLLENTSKFYSHFEGHELQYMVDRTHHSYDSDIFEVKEKLRNSITEIEFLREMGIEIRLLGFILVPETPLSKYLQTTVEFQDYHYVINPQHLVGNSDLPEIKKLYDKRLTEEEIEDYVKKDGFSIIEHLESHYYSFNKD